jgi:Resolvase, N terminal domain
MSTEHQQFSIENQMVAIRADAQRHDLNSVRTYSEEARSGIDLARRLFLNQLLATSKTKQRTFEPCRSMTSAGGADFKTRMRALAMSFFAGERGSTLSTAPTRSSTIRA